MFDSKWEESERVKVFVKGKLLKGVSPRGQKDRSRGEPPDFKFQRIEGAAQDPLGEQKRASPNQSAPCPLGRLLTESATQLRELLEHSADPSLGRRVPSAHRRTTTLLAELACPFAEFGELNFNLGEENRSFGDQKL